MTSDNFNAIDLNRLDILSAENPPQFLDSFDTICHQHSFSGSVLIVMYFKAKSLVLLDEYEEAIQLSTELLGKAVVMQDHYLLVKCNILLSRCYYYSEAKYRAKPCLDLAVEYAQASESAELLAEVFANLGSYYLDLHDLETAENYMLKAVKLTKRLPASYTIITILGKVSSVFYALQKFDTEVLYLSAALKMCDGVHVTKTKLMIISDLAKAYSAMYKHKMADELINKGIRLCAQSNNPRSLLLFTFNLASSKTHQKKADDAILLFDRCMTIAHDLQIENPRFYMDIYNNYAICHGLNKDHLKTLEYLNMAYSIAEQIDSIKDCMHINTNKSHALVNMGSYAEAEELLREVIEFYKVEQNYDMLISAQLNMADLYEKRKDLRSSLKAHKELEKSYRKYITHITNERTEAAHQQIMELSKCYRQINSSEAQSSEAHLDRDHLEFVGTSEAHTKVMNSALLAAQNPNTNVFLIGESGTGKEIIAQMIHHKSLRRGFPFVAVNASAISPNLVESALFGHKKGSFTGAISDTIGYFVQADKGTLFLDEITEMPLEMQAKLLRAIESRRVTPVGGSKEVSFDCRIISSTNRNIFELIQHSEFRLDLFHRLNPLEIYIPSLKERKEDIEILVHHFIDLYTKGNKRTKPIIDSSFLDYLQNYDFPGNARELRNIIERLFILANSNLWDASVCGLINKSNQDYNRPTPLYLKIQVEETEAIIKALIKSGGKQKHAAKLLNMSESTLTRRIEKYQLQDYTSKGR